MTRPVFMFGTILFGLAGLARAAPPPLVKPTSPVPPIVVNNFPPGEHWHPAEYRQAVTQLMARNSKKGPLPRMAGGAAGDDFLRFVNPAIDPERDTDQKILIDLVLGLEKVRGAYRIVMNSDPSAAREVGALLGTETRITARIAELVNRPENAALQPAAFRVIVDCLVAMASISPLLGGAPSEGVNNFLALMEGFLTRALPVLPQSCRREVVARIGLTIAHPTHGVGPVQEMLERIREAGVIPVEPRLDRLIQRGMPAPDRAWAMDDAARAVEILKLLPAAELPRLEDPVMGGLVRRLTDTPNLVWIEDTDFALGDRALLTTSLAQQYSLARNLYLKASTPGSHAGDAKVDFCAEVFALDEAILEMFRRQFALEDEHWAKIAPDDPVASFVGFGRTLAQNTRPAVVSGLVRAAGPLGDEHVELRRKYLEALSRNVPQILPHLTAEGRSAVATATHELGQPAPPEALTPAYTALVTAVTAPPGTK